MSKKILAIDDHRDTLQLIELALQRHDYEVLGATSGQEGIELAIEEQPDLILLDFMMPGMDGIAVCKLLREHPTLQTVPIIMFTAKVHADDKRGSFEVGADDYLTKPTKPAELLQRVEALLSRRQHDRPQEDEPAPLAMPASPAPALISVLGARGGAGATTVAVNLAVCLADGGQETMLVDLDVGQGHVGLYLGHDVERDVMDWLNLPAGSLEETLADHLIEHENRLHLLLSRARPDVALRETQLAALLAVLRKIEHPVVIDLGRHPGDTMRPLLEQSDTLVLCLRPERPALNSARHLLDYLREVTGRTDHVRLLMIDYDQNGDLPRSLVENYLDAPLFDVFKIKPGQISRALNRSQPLVHTPGMNELQEQVQALARQVVTA